MRRELLVALLFVLHLHLFNGFANDRPCGVEHPCASGASPALKILSFDSYQFATHRLHGTPRDLVCYVQHWPSTHTATTNSTLLFAPERDAAQVAAFEHAPKPK